MAGSAFRTLEIHLNGPLHLRWDDGTRAAPSNMRFWRYWRLHQDAPDPGHGCKPPFGVAPGKTMAARACGKP